MFSTSRRRLALAACVLVAGSVIAAGAGSVVRVPLIHDGGWHSTPDFYAAEDAFLMARHTRGGQVRTYANGVIHKKNAIYNWERRAFDEEQFVFLICGAELPHWTISVTNGYSLEVYGDGEAAQMLTAPGYWWTAEGKVYHHAELNSEIVGFAGARFTIASFAAAQNTTEDHMITSTYGSPILVNVAHSGTLSYKQTNTSHRSYKGPQLSVAFKSTSMAKLAEIPYGPTQLQSVSAKVNQAPDAQGQIGNMGKWSGTATAWDGTEPEPIAILDVP